MRRLLVIAILVLSVVGLALAGDMKHPSLPLGIHNGEPCLVGQTCVGSGGSATLTSLTASVNNVLTMTAPPYNAKGDGLADDWQVGQNAINAACASTNPLNVLFPTPPNCYLHSKPWIVPCSNIDIKGADSGGVQVPSTSLCQNYDGPAFIVNSPSNTQALTYAAPIGTLGGNSLKIANPSVGINGSVTLSDYVNTPSTNLNNLNALDIQGMTLMTTLDGGQQNYLFDCGDPLPGIQANCLTPIYVDITNSNKLTWKINTASSGVVTIVGPVITNAELVYWHVSKSGAACHFWVNGTDYSGAPTTCTGNTVQSAFDQTNFPPNFSNIVYPNEGDDLIGGDLADNGFVWISNTARADSGTPAAKPTADANTVLLCTWDTPTGQAINGTQYCTNGTHTGSVRPVYLPMRGNISTFLAGVHIHDFALNSSTASFADGVFVRGTFQSEFNNLELGQNGSAGGFGIDNPFSFYTTVHNNYLVTVANPIILSGAGDVSYDNIVGSGHSCYVGWSTNITKTGDKCNFNGASGQVLDSYFETSTVNESGHSVDLEETNAQLDALFYATALYAPSTEYDLQNVESSNNAPLAIIQNSFYPLNFTSGAFTIHDGAPSEVIDIVSPIAFKKPVKLSSISLPPTIPVSNDPQYVFVDGATVVTFTQLNTITCPTAELAPDGAQGWLVSNATTCTTGSLITSSPGTTYCTAICQNGVGWVH